LTTSTATIAKHHTSTTIITSTVPNQVSLGVNIPTCFLPFLVPLKDSTWSFTHIC